MNGTDDGASEDTEDAWLEEEEEDEEEDIHTATVWQCVKVSPCVSSFDKLGVRRWDIDR